MDKALATLLALITAALILLASLILFSNKPALAQVKVPVSIVRADGPNALSEGDAYRAFFGVRERFRELGLELKLRRFVNTADLYPQSKIDSFAFADTLNYWRREVRLKRYSRRHWLTYVVLPPVSYSARLWISGIATSTCTNQDAVAIGNATMKNADGMDRFPHSQVIMQHEIGHLLGASHFEDYYNVMSGTANHQFFTNGSYPPWAILSVGQIYFCRERQNLFSAVTTTHMENVHMENVHMKELFN